MLLYNSIGPNPRVVRIFMAERGIELPRVEVDLRGGENRGERRIWRRTHPANVRRWNWTTARLSPRSPRSANTSTRSRPVRR